MNKLLSIIRAATPVGLLELRRSVLSRRSHVALATELSASTKWHNERNLRIKAVATATRRRRINADCYEDMVSYLVEQGIPEVQIREGSIPFESLQFINDTVFATLDASKPSATLHLGNFVGVSLAYFTNRVATLSPGSVVVAVDPNIPHRAIDNPQAYVTKLLSICGLERNVILITGYSMEKNISSDGVVFEDYDPVKNYEKEASCENVLNSMTRFFENTFDVACLDGNHEASYLEREVKQIIPLMREGGWIIFDDVDDNWTEIRDAFRRISKFGLESMATDGRVGIARFTDGRTNAGKSLSGAT
jgi:hypothetical protein